MKLLIVFALVAVAFAEEIRIVPLPLAPPGYTQPSMGQVFIPNDILDAIKIGLPVMRDDVVIDEGLKVIFVDAPLDVVLEDEQVFESPEPVVLGEAPLPAFETADSAPEAVRFVDGPLDAAPEIAIEAVKIAEPSLPEVVAPVAEEEIVPGPVNFVDSPLPASEAADVDAESYDHAFLDDAPAAEEIVPEPVHFVDAPLPEVDAPVAEEIVPGAVNFVDSPLPASEAADVDAESYDHAFLDDAPVAEEIVPEPVMIAEAVLPEDADLYAVKFVDAPLDVEAVRVAEPSLPAEEVAPVAEDIVPEPVHFVDSPLPAFEADVDAAMFDDAPLDVEAVRVAMPVIGDYRGKQFDDPMLR